MNFIENITRLHFKDFINDKNRLRYILKSGPNTTTVFLFCNKDKNPFGILRISLKKNRVDREYKVLKIIENINTQKIQNISPLPVHYSTYSNLQIASYLYLAGREMLPNTKDLSILTNHLILVRKWLQSLGNLSPSSQQIDEIFPYISTLERFNTIFEKSKIEKKILEELFGRINDIENEVFNKNINKNICHGDLKPQHIFLKNKFEIVGVIDWECSFLGWTPIDWFYFICCYFCPIPLGVSLQEMLIILKKAFFSDNEISQIILIETEKLFESLNIDKNLMYNFFILGLFNYIFTIVWSNLSSFRETISIFYEKNSIFLK